LAEHSIQLINLVGTEYGACKGFLDLMYKYFLNLYSAIIVGGSVIVFGFPLFILGLIMPLLFAYSPNQGRVPPMGPSLRRSWARFVLWAHRVRIEMDGPGLTYLKDGQARIIVSNHQSALDIFVNSATLPKKIFFLAKKELFWVPIFGLAAWMAGTIYVDRKKGRRDRKAFDGISQSLANGNSIFIYPEGTRSKDGKLQLFKRGAFILAIEYQTEILPVSILNSHELMPKGALYLKPGIVKMWVDKPVPTKGMSEGDRYRLCELVQNQIAKNLDR